MEAAVRNYADVEKEQLGVVFACERFHTYGRKTIVDTDHCPLVAISRKHMCDASPVLQRLLLRIQKYDLNLEYTRGRSTLGKGRKRHILLETYSISPDSRLLALSRYCTSLELVV